MTEHPKRNLLSQSGNNRYADEHTLIDALRSGEEAAFVAIVARYQGPMLRLARLYVWSTVVAEEVVQATWLGLLTGFDRFERRSSLKAWIFHILVNRARTRGARESRSIPFADLVTPDDQGTEPAVDPAHFQSQADP